MPDIQDSTHVDPSWELPWGVAYLQGNDDSVQLMDQGGIPVLEVLGGDDEHSALEDGDTLPKAQFIVRAVNAHESLLAALEAIAKGEGRYNRDPLEHCNNTVEDMKALAEAAIASAEGEAS